MSYFSVNPKQLTGPITVTGNLTVTGDLDVQGSTTVVTTTTSGQVIIDITNTESLLIRKDADAGDVFAVDTTNSNILVTASDITWASGKAVTAASYAIQRDVDATNQLHFNIPTGASFEFSVNDVAQATLDVSTLNMQINTITGIGTAVTGTAGTALTISTPAHATELAGTNITIRASTAVTGTAQNYAGGIIQLYPGAATGTQSPGYVDFLGTDGTTRLSASSYSSVDFLFASAAASITYFGILANPPTLDFAILRTASSVNYMQMAGAIASSSPSITMTGSDTNIGLSITAKATGILALSGYETHTRALADATVGFSFTSSTSAAGTANRTLMSLSMTAGTTTSASTGAFTADNLAAGTGDDFVWDSGYGYRTTGNNGVSAYSRATTTGTNTGGQYLVKGGNNNVGIFGGATVPKNAAINIGNVGFGSRDTFQDSGTTDSTVSNKLADSTQNFVTTVAINDIVRNTTTNQTATVSAVDSNTALSLSRDIMTTGQAYVIIRTATTTAREFGGWFGLYTTTAVNPTWGTSAAIVACNGTGAGGSLSDIADFRDNGTSVFNIADFGYVEHTTQNNSFLGSQNYFIFTGATDTNLTASTEVIGWVWSSATSKTWAAGNITIQREYAFAGPQNYQITGGASTIADCSTVEVISAPGLATGTVATRLSALSIGQYYGTTTGTNYGIFVNQPGITTGLGSVTAVTALGIGSIASTISLGNQTANLTTLTGLSVGSQTYVSTTNTRTVTGNVASIYIAGAPVASTNVTFTNTNGTTVNALHVASGTSRFDGRVLKTQGADVASANDLTLGADGNVFEITGTTQVNAITTSGWQNGTQIVLLFTSTPTVKHNTAGGAGTAVMLLAGAADFAATAGDTLTLMLSEIGGTQAWRELARAAI